MIFVSNEHVLMQFTNKKFVTFNIDGSVFIQPEVVQQYLDRTERKIEESILEHDTKYLVLECNEDKGPTIIVICF